jgi:lysine/arginine/ornithine transport system substrate-binding protein
MCLGFCGLDALKKDGTLSQLSQKYFKRDIISK